MSNKVKRRVPAAKGQEAPSYSSQPQRLAGATIMRTVGGDVTIGPCIHQMQFLSNGAVLVIFYEESSSGAVTKHTYALGEEVCGIVTEPAMIDAPGDDS